MKTVSSNFNRISFPDLWSQLDVLLDMLKRILVSHGSIQSELGILKKRANACERREKLLVMMAKQGKKEPSAKVVTSPPTTSGENIPPELGKINDPTKVGHVQLGDEESSKDRATSLGTPFIQIPENIESKVGQQGQQEVQEDLLCPRDCMEVLFPEEHIPPSKMTLLLKLILAAISTQPDGISKKMLLERMVKKGFDRGMAEAAIKRAVSEETLLEFECEDGDYILEPMFMSDAFEKQFVTLPK